MKRIFAALVFSFLLAGQAFALAVPEPPFAYVRDDAGILSESTENSLDAYLAEIEDGTSGEVAVLTIAALEDEALEEFATEVFREWGVGQEAFDNGVLLFVAMEDRAIRIEVGYGLEGRITDFNSKRIIENTLVPAFQAGNYESGIEDAVHELGDLIQVEAEEEGFKEAPASSGGFDFTEVIVVPIAIGFVTAVGIVLLLMMLPLKKAEVLQKWPLTYVTMVPALFKLNADFSTWLWGLFVAMGIYLAIKNLDLEKVKSGGGGGGGSSYRKKRSYSSRRSGAVGRRSSGGRRFGGGSSGGGGASGRF